MGCHALPAGADPHQPPGPCRTLDKNQSAVGGHRPLSRAARRVVSDAIQYRNRLTANFPALRVEWNRHQTCGSGKYQMSIGCDLGAGATPSE